MSTEQGVELVIPGENPAEAYLPRARRDQLTVEDWDQALLAMARLSRPGVFWWFGYRTLEGRETAVCYVCGEKIAKVTSRGTVYRPTMDRIMRHRATHHMDAVSWLAR